MFTGINRSLRIYLVGHFSNTIMKFSLRVAAVVILCVCVVLLYFSEWLTTGSIGAFMSSLKDGQSSSSKFDARKWIESSNLKYTSVFETALGKKEKISKCSLAQKRQAPADIKSWEILEQMSPEESGKRFKNGVVVSDDDDDHHRKKIETDPERDAKARKGTLKVIVVPHSHNDPGWHKTLDGYFEDQTKPTLDNMVKKMMKFPKMTFIWAESVFLSLWWSGIDEATKSDVQALIREGRLEIVVGSWVVPDEANPHYYALVDQMIEGHQWLWNNMRATPNNTWALDPFGYSSSLPYLYKKAGFKNMVILRVHENVKNELIKKKALDFMWRQPWDFEGDDDIRTQLMPYKLYNIKHTCGPDHHICLLFDFRKISGEVSESRAEPITPQNIDRLSKLLLGQYEKKAQLFQHNVILVPLGDDFRYDRDIEWDQQYKNYMMLFNYINNKKEWNVEARFGTIQDFFNELDAELKNNPDIKLPTLEGDFFPYTDEHNDFWTGYFTSRAFDKNLGRELESHLRMADMFNALATARSLQEKSKFPILENFKFLEEAHQSLGLFQHHDAITGTARSYVVIDYENRLNRAILSAQTVILNSAKYLLNSQEVLIDIDDAHSLKTIMLKRKVISLSHQGTDIVFMNSLTFRRQELVHLLISHDTVEVISNEGDIIPSQISPIWRTMELSDNEYELVFFVDIPPMGMRTYKVRATGRNTGRNNTASVIYLYNTQDYRVPKSIRFRILPPNKQSIILENDEYRLRFSPRTGLMHSVTTKTEIQTTRLNMQYLLYKSRGSGAYIFFPAGPAIDSEMSSRPPVRVINGPLMSEVHVIQKMLTSIVRVYHTAGHLSKAISIEHVTDMIDMDDKELIMRLETDIQSNGLFYTDSNGISMVQRKRNSRFGVQANYYPMTSMAHIQDARSRLSIITGQPLGVTSPTDGGLEVMLDRRLRYDDGRGMGEGVMDNKKTPSRFYLVLERGPSKSTTISLPSLQNHLLADQLNYPVFTLFATKPSEVTTREYSAISANFPCDARVVSMRTLKSDGPKVSSLSFALVLHKLGFDCEYPHPVLNQCQILDEKITFRDLFKGLKVEKAQETTLSLMHNKKDLSVSEELSLSPMELYTYRLIFSSTNTR